MRCVFAAAITASLLLACPAEAVPLALDRPLWEFLEPDAPADHLTLVKSYGPSGPVANGAGNATDNGDGFSESEMGSFGCIIGGTLGTIGSVALGGQNVINLIAGGLVLPANPGALYVSLFGVVFASFCAVGQALTPAVVHAYRRYFEDGELPPPAAAPAPRDPPLLSRQHRTSYQPISYQLDVVR